MTDSPCDNDASAACPTERDRQLVDRYLDGDAAAGNELAEMLAPLIHKIVCRVLGPGRIGDWDEAFQSANLRIFERLRTWKAQCPLLGWAAVVASRRTLDIRHKRWPLNVPSDVLDSMAEAPRTSDPDLGECIRKVIGGFPDHWRTVLQLDLDGTNHKEIAQRLGKSRRTIQYWLEKMRNALVHCIEG